MSRGEVVEKKSGDHHMAKESLGVKMVVENDLEERREGGLLGEGDEACSSGFLSLM